MRRNRAGAIRTAVLAGAFLAGQVLAARDVIFAPQSLRTELDRVEAASSWPGFNPDAVPAAVFDGAKTYLFDHPRPPRDFKPLEGDEGIRVFEGRYSGIDAGPKLRIGETWVAACLAARAPRSPGQGQAFTMRALAEIILQQKFQIFLARRHPDWVPDPALRLTCPTDDERSLTLRRLELAALRRAVEAGAEAEAASWAAEGLKHRSQRLGLLDAGTARYERSLERFEGIAEFIKCAAAGAPADREASGGDANDEGGDGASRCSVRAGCLIACLLERFVPDWKERLESGAPDDIEAELARAVASYPPKPTFSTAELIEIRRRAEEDLAARAAERTALFREFLSRPGFRVEVIAEDDPLRPVAFDYDGLVRLTDNESIHRGPLTFKNDTATLEVRGGALSVHRGTPGAVRILATGLAQKPAILKGSARTRGVTVIKAGGLTLTGRNIKVFKSGEALTVVLSGPPR